MAAQTRVGVRRPGIWDGLLAYYRADGTPVDQTGNGYDLTLINGTTYDTGKINQGFLFDGVNDYASYSGDVGVTGDFSVNLWVKPNIKTSSNFFQSANFISLTNGSFGLSFVSGSAIFTMIKTTGGSLAQDGGVVGTGNWVMLTVIWNETTKRAKIYYNGSIYTDSVRDFTGCTSADLTNGFMLSRRLSAQYYNGLEDEIGIWNRELTPTEVSQLYNSGNGKQK